MLFRSCTSSHSIKTYTFSPTAAAGIVSPALPAPVLRRVVQRSSIPSHSSFQRSHQRRVLLTTTRTPTSVLTSDITRSKGSHSVATSLIQADLIVKLSMVASQVQRRAHGGSAHDKKPHDHGHKHGLLHHHHHHDTTYLTSRNKKDAGVRITRLGLFVNLAMAISKGIGGYIFHSQALIADAIHSLTDLVSDLMTLATVSLSLKPPSERFPTGYGKMESLGSLGVSGLLLTGGVLMGWNSCDVLFTQFFLDGAASAGEHAGHSHGGHGHSHSHTDFGPNINAIWIVGASIIIKEYLYRATMKIALAKKSTVLASNAVHHRVDSLSSLVALVAIAGSNVLDNAAWLDPVGGLLVSLMVIKAGWENTGLALLELADAAVESNIKDSVRDAAQVALNTVALREYLPQATSLTSFEIQDIQGVKSGQNHLIELQICAPPQMQIAQLKHFEEAVRDRIAAKVKSVRRLKIRFVSTGSEATSLADEFIPRDLDDIEPEGIAKATAPQEQNKKRN